MKLRATQKHCRELNMKSSSLVNGRKSYIIISGKIMERKSNGSLRSFYYAGRINAASLIIAPSAGPASTPHLANFAPSVVALPTAIKTACSTSLVIAAGVTPSVVTHSKGS